MDFATRDALLNAAVTYTASLTGKTRDRALFDYLAGACEALFVAGQAESSVPPWLFVIGARGGDRLKEIERMLHAG
jgi:hypothetical protein